MTTRSAHTLIRKHGILLVSARGPIPNLAEAIAGEPIRGSWWGHRKGHDIFRILTAVTASADLIVCRLVNGKQTLLHRRVWPAVVRLADRLPKERLASVRQEHTPQGRHRTVEIPFPRWVPASVIESAGRMTEEEARADLGETLARSLIR